MNTLILEKVKDFMKLAVSSGKITDEEFSELYASGEKPVMNPLQLYTQNETAELLRVHRTTIWRYIKDGMLESIYLDKTPRIPAISIQKFIESGKKVV